MSYLGLVAFQQKTFDQWVDYITGLIAGFDVTAPILNAGIDMQDSFASSYAFKNVSGKIRTAVKDNLIGSAWAFSDPSTTRTNFINALVDLVISTMSELGIFETVSNSSHAVAVINNDLISYLNSKITDAAFQSAVASYGKTGQVQPDRQVASGGSGFVQTGTEEVSGQEDAGSSYGTPKGSNQSYKEDDGGGSHTYTADTGDEDTGDEDTGELTDVGPGGPGGLPATEPDPTPSPSFPLVPVLIGGVVLVLMLLKK